MKQKKIVRPWEKNNDIQNSFSGNQALNRAKEIVTKNNTMVEDLRRAGAQEKNIEAIERLIREKEIEFENLEKKDFNQRKIASNKGILGRMKNLFYTN